MTNESFVDMDLHVWDAMQVQGENDKIGIRTDIDRREAHEIDWCCFEPIGDLLFWPTVERLLPASSQFNFQFYFIHLPIALWVCAHVVAATVNLWLLRALPFMTIVSEIFFFIYFYLRSSLFLNRSIYLICMGWFAGRVGRTSVLKPSSQLINNYEYYIRHSFTRSTQSATRLYAKQNKFSFVPEASTENAISAAVFVVVEKATNNLKE